MKEYSWKLIYCKEWCQTTNARSNSKNKFMRTYKGEQKTNILQEQIALQTFCTYWSRYKHFALIDRATKKSKEKEFTKKKNHLINKFEILKSSTEKKSKQKATSYIKQAVVNLTNTDLVEKQKSLLNFGLNFLPANKIIPFMDIISATETCSTE